jgi:predicted amidophosphoribosyltransferase
MILVSWTIRQCRKCGRFLKKWGTGGHGICHQCALKWKSLHPENVQRWNTTRRVKRHWLRRWKILQIKAYWMS